MRGTNVLGALEITRYRMKDRFILHYVDVYKLTVQNSYQDDVTTTM